MPDIQKRLGRDILVIDGAMGTMLQRAGVPGDHCPEQLNITAAEILSGIHHDYVLAGADCVTTNSFGGSRVKLAEYGLGHMVEEFNRAAVKLAKHSGVQHVLADVGPTGLVLEPLGKASFDEVFEIFREQIAALAAEGPDAILIETMTDIAEARCAVLAAREACDLPVFVTVSFGASGRMDLSGTDPETAAVVLEAAGADAVGMNCGLGPEQMLPLAERMLKATQLPIIVQPNAGMPRLVDGVTVFPGTADELGQTAARLVEMGVELVGSCCGSTPAFTGAISDFARLSTLGTRSAPSGGVVLAGPRGLARIGGGARFALIGERINPTGKKRLAASLREGSMGVVRELAAVQQEAGAQLLDVNVGAVGVDATVALPQAVRALIGLADVPLVLDTTDAVALEAALRIYPGRALVNSVNGDPESMDTVLPLAKRYGAAVVVLALDEHGIPATTEGRLEVVHRVRERAHAYGLVDADLVVDCLTLTTAADADAARITLDAVRVVSREWGLACMLGVSNVSHGLPGRGELNATFLNMAMAEGLDAAIVDPTSAIVTAAITAGDALLGHDVQAARWIAHIAEHGEAAVASATGASHATSSPGAPAPEVESTDTAGMLAMAVERGDVDSGPGLVDELISAGSTPQSVIADVLTPAIQRLGDGYGRGEVFLPQLIAAAEAMKAAVGRAKSHFPAGAAAAEGRVVFGTVKGDVHSIGKDICISMLESHGMAVEDLGVDVSAERFVAAAQTADVVCLSALMTTSLPAMDTCVREVQERTGVPVLVGGAVVTAEYASGIGAGYSADAPGCVAAVKSALASGEKGIR